jgi:hypothetical protein
MWSKQHNGKVSLARLDSVSRRFFETQFFSKTFDDTRQQVLTRLWGILSNRVLERMFANKRNKLNLFEAMNRGSLILINTAKDLLKQEGCAILGRFFRPWSWRRPPQRLLSQLEIPNPLKIGEFVAALIILSGRKWPMRWSKPFFIALICQAAQERASIPEDRRKSTFVYIDEAHDYFDASIENLLNQARKYKVGLILANQNLDQFSTRLCATVMASTSIKMVGGLSAKDAAVFAKEMGCEPEFLQSMRKSARHTQFACFVRNHTEHPIALTVPFGTMEQQPKITAAAHALLIQQNRSRFCEPIENPTLPRLPVHTRPKKRADFILPKPDLL